MPTNRIPNKILHYFVLEKPDAESRVWTLCCNDQGRPFQALIHRTTAERFVERCKAERAPVRLADGRVVPMLYQVIEVEVPS